MTSTTTTRPRSTKKYQALVALGLTDEQALAVLAKPAAPTDPRAQLAAAGMSEAEIDRALAALSSPAPSSPAPSPRERAEALVAQRGLTFARGRVYVTPDIVEACVRVRKTGTPEVVASSGVGRTTAVLLAREESGDVSVQNLTAA